MGKRLVAFFSAGGTTKKTAKMVAEAAGADLYEITPAVAYTSADLDWTNKKSRSINTFLEKYDFSGKKIILFATSGGSGFGNTGKELQPSAPGAKIVEGKILNRTNKQESENWVKTW